MNIVSVSAAGLVIFTAYLIVVSYLLRMLSERFHEKAWAQGLAALVH